MLFKFFAITVCVDKKTYLFFFPKNKKAASELTLFVKFINISNVFDIHIQIYDTIQNSKQREQNEKIDLFSTHDEIHVKRRILKLRLSCNAVTVMPLHIRFY